MSNSATTAPAELEAIRSVIRDAVKRIGQFVCQPEFQILLEELYALDESDRASFVLGIILNEQERKKRGVVVPHGLVVQRSTFADGRPTLFCVAQHVPLAHPWDKVTVTFDSEQAQGRQISQTS